MHVRPAVSTSALTMDRARFRSHMPAVIWTGHGRIWRRGPRPKTKSTRLWRGDLLLLSWLWGLFLLGWRSSLILLASRGAFHILLRPVWYTEFSSNPAFVIWPLYRILEGVKSGSRPNNCLVFPCSPHVLVPQGSKGLSPLSMGLTPAINCCQEPRIRLRR